METHLFPNGDLEVGTGKPGYRWVPAYSEATPEGFSMPLTRRHWQDIAKRDGLALKFHKTKDAARNAIAKATNQPG